MRCEGVLGINNKVEVVASSERAEGNEEQHNFKDCGLLFVVGERRKWICSLGYDVVSRVTAPPLDWSLGTGLGTTFALD